MQGDFIKTYRSILLAWGLISCSPLVAPEIDQSQALSRSFTWSATRTPTISAHRGGTYPGFPEKCLETFEYVLEQDPLIIECDVEETADGVLILIHDETLDRTTNGKGKVGEQSWDQLKSLRLKDINDQLTDFQIPTLKETLEWARGRTVLMIDIKRSVPFEKVVDLIEREGVENNVVLITYTLGAAEILHEINPDLMLSLRIRNLEELERFLQSDIDIDRMVAFVGTSEPIPELYHQMHNNGIFCILGTLGNLDRRAVARGDRVYREFIARGADILATDRPLEVGAELTQYWELSVPGRQPELVEN